MKAGHSKIIDMQIIVAISYAFSITNKIKKSHCNTSSAMIFFANWCRGFRAITGAEKHRVYVDDQSKNDRKDRC